MDYLHTCVIGGGVVGLAIARSLAQSGKDVMVLDRDLKYGQGISSRNSEVIHAGIYYPRDSLKASLCVRGKALLYEYCSAHNVAFRRCGKLIVATEQAEEDELDKIMKQGMINGVDDLEYWSQEKIKSEEPDVRATLALLSPSTGVISSHDLMTAYLADLETAGGMFIGGARVKAIEIKDDGYRVHCEIDDGTYDFCCTVLVNSAGLGAQQISHAIDGSDHSLIPPLYYVKGSYFTMSGKPPFNRLIYPVPEKSGAGLGVHATIDLAGQVKFGPDVEYIKAEDYTVSEDKLDAFYEAVRRYFPGLADGQLTPGYVGIRPKLQGPGDSVKDYVIQTPDEHGLPGMVHLYGIESPGLTSSLAIAEYVTNSLADFY